MCSTGGEQRREAAACTAGAQIAWASLRYFSRDPQNNKKEPERVAGRGKFGIKVPRSLDLLLLFCLLSPGWSHLLLHLWVLVPYLLSAASPAPVLQFSIRFH